MKLNFYSALLGVALFVLPSIAYAQMPFSPCSPFGGKRADVIGAEGKYRAPNGAAPTFTIPAGTKSISVYISSETGLTSSTDYQRGDEDFLTINAIIDIAANTSSGYVNVAKNTNTNGSGTNVYGWKNAPLGTFISPARKIGDATPDLNNVNFTIAGNTLTIVEAAVNTHSSFYVEYLSPYNNSLNPLDPQVRSLLHGTGTAATDLTIPIPTGTQIISISAKGTNSSAVDLNSASGTEEGYSNMRFLLDLNNGMADGFITLANGGSADRRSTYVINNKPVTAAGSMTTSGVITGDYSGKLTSEGAVGLFNPEIYVSGGELLIRRDVNYARDFDDAYVIEFYSRVGLGMSAEFIDSDVRDIPKGFSSSTGVSRTFKIPSGTNAIYFNQTGNAVNTDREENENGLSAYAYIDLNTETATGYFYQQVGLSQTVRRDDNYAFKNVPLNNASTRGHTSATGFKGPNPYDISFQLSADKSELTVTNKTGLAGSDYQFLLSADFFGARPDVAFSATNVSFSKGSSCKVVRASVNVCNPGAGNSNGGMPVSFYAGNPTVDPAARLLHVGAFNEDLAVGECKTFNFDIDLSAFSNLNIDLTIIINDNGSFVSGGVGNAVGTPFTLSSLVNQGSLYRECYFENNLLTKTINVNNCPVVDLDPDRSGGAGTPFNYLDYFTAGSATGTPIADADATIIDLDASNIHSATITLTNRLNGAGERLTYLGSFPRASQLSGTIQT
ncbi:hypothetical protein MKQ68_11685 [Chitinophaga horti]|uniref:IgGFc-binding protein N-terminal domain-containing protein n=1 Tax=Chitinophaga horti TaxID=2920382 RepID=A0ABY6J7U2_9BACT|nr:hypothetical protein [Chitinophaga horti]UYQ95763.1 hypothetical protein MKQ68_11685 [Chitinophaga horti]